MANLLDSVKEHLHPGFIAETAEWLNEGEEQTGKALQAWCATILAGLLDWVGHAKAMNQIFDRLEHFPPDLTENPKVLLHAGNLAENDPKGISGYLLGQLFGPKIDALTNSVAAFSGAKPDNVSKLLGIAGPVVLSVLGQRVQAGALNVSGLSNLFLINQDRILSALPSGIGAILDLRHIKPIQEEIPEESTGIHWVLPLLLLLALGGSVMVYLRYCGE